MRILFYIGSLRTGGTEIQLLKTAAGLAGRGHDVSIVTMFPGGRYWDEARSMPQLTVDSLFRGKAGSKPLVLGQLVLAPRRLGHYLATSRPDVLYSMLHMSNYHALRASGPERGHRIVWGLRAGDMDLPWFREFARRRCALGSGAVDAVVANSESSLRWHEGIGFASPRNTVIVNGIDTELFKPDPEGGGQFRQDWGFTAEQALVGLVGRLTEAKDHGTFLAAAARVAERIPDARFVCIGSGKPGFRHSLEELARSRGLADRLVWAGECRNMAAAYSALDLMVLSSSHESFPNVVAEAMSCDRPCVVTDVGDARAIVVEADPVVPPRDPEALADGIELALTSTGSGRGFRRQRVLEHFSVEIMLDRTEALFKELGVDEHD